MPKIRNIYKRKLKDSTVWEVKIRRKGYPVQTHSFDKKNEAEKWARKIESEIDGGMFVSRKEAENTTLSEALDRYEREVIPAKKGAKQESVRVRFWKKSTLAPRFLAAIQGKDIALWRDARLKEVAPNTVRHELALLSHLFTIAVKEWGMASLANPVRQIRMPKMPAGRDRRLKNGELERVLAASESVMLPPVAGLALETGMRQAEIAGMTWDMVSLKNKKITLLDTKNGEKRDVPLSPKAISILSDLPRPNEGKVWNFSTPTSVAVAWRRAVERARATYEKECEEKNEKSDPEFLKDLHFHDLRHEATSRFFEMGLDTMEVSAITGHKTLQMLKRYTHLKAENLAEKLAARNVGQQI